MAYIRSARVGKPYMTAPLQAALYYIRKRRRAAQGGADIPGDSDDALMDFTDPDNAGMNIAE